MPPSLKINRVALKHICFEDSTFSLNPFDDEVIPAALSQQIQRCGILHPPILLERTGTSFAIVSGRKRLRLAATILQTASCECLIIPAGYDELETLAIALDESAIGMALSPMQKAIFCQKALALASEQEIAARFLPVMGLTPHIFQLRQLLALLVLEQPIAAAVHSGGIDLKAALELCSLNFRDRLVLFDLIANLSLSVGNQRKLIALCRDLAKREDTSIMSILSDSQLNEISSLHGENIPQKTSALMTWLHSKHAPAVTAAEKEFAQLPRKLNLPEWAVLTHSPAFEKDRLTLSLTFQNYHELEKFWKDHG